MKYFTWQYFIGELSDDVVDNRLRDYAKHVAGLAGHVRDALGATLELPYHDGVVTSVRLGCSSRVIEVESSLLWPDGMRRTACIEYHGCRRIPNFAGSIAAALALKGSGIMESEVDQHRDRCIQRFLFAAAGPLRRRAFREVVVEFSVARLLSIAEPSASDKGNATSNGVHLVAD